MAETRIEHRFACSEAVFWGQVFFDPEYNRRLFLEELRFPRYRVLEYREDENQVVRLQEITPRVVGLPGPLQALVGEGFSYLERGVFTRASHRLDIQVTSSKLSDKIQFRGVFSTTPEGERQCRRVFLCTVECRLLGIGGLLEQHILTNTRREYDATAAFTRRYLVERGLA